jgi:hypothetical protein
MRCVAVAVLIVAALSVVAGPAAAGAGSGPKVTVLSYFNRDDGSLPHRVLMANARRTASLRFSTVFRGKHASAAATYNDNIGRRLTDKHPWVLQHNASGGGKVYGLIRRSLADRGSAAVRVRARRGDRVDPVKLKIRVADCTADPPFYPLDCTIHR